MSHAHAIRIEHVTELTQEVLRRVTGGVAGLPELENRSSTMPYGGGGGELLSGDLGEAGEHDAPGEEPMETSTSDLPELCGGEAIACQDEGDLDASLPELPDLPEEPGLPELPELPDETGLPELPDETEDVLVCDGPSDDHDLGLPDVPCEPPIVVCEAPVPPLDPELFGADDDAEVDLDDVVCKLACEAEGDASDLGATLHRSWQGLGETLHAVCHA